MDGRQHCPEICFPVRKIDRSRNATPQQASLAAADVGVIARILGGDIGSCFLPGFGGGWLRSRLGARHAGFGYQLQCDPTARAAVSVGVGYPAHP